MKVGQIVFTRTPCGPRSIAIALVIPSIPCLVEQYTVRLGPPTKPMSDEIFDDRTSFARLYHPTGDCLCREKCRSQVKPHHLIEILHRHVEKCYRPVCACVVDQNSECFTTCYRSRGRIEISDVQHDGFSGPAFMANALCDFIYLGCGPRGENHMGTSLSECRRTSLADTAPGSGHQGATAIQSK